jgi:hypothetical protein
MYSSAASNREFLHVCTWETAMSNWPEKPFAFLSQHSVDLQLVTTDPCKQEVATEIVQNVSCLADSGRDLIRGIFPRKSPYFSWGAAEYLRWYGALESSDEALNNEIVSISVQILNGRSVQGRGPKIAESYELQIPPNCHLVQFLAAEVLLTLEGMLEAISTASFASALIWQHAAFANLIEASLRAIDVSDETPPLRLIH